jgi:hypothetical protein
VGLQQSLAAFQQIGYAPVRPRRRAPAPARRSGRAARTASSRHLFRDLQRVALLLPSALLLLLLPAPLPCVLVQASTSSALGSRELRPLPCALLRRLRAAPPWRPVFSPPPVCAPLLRAPRSSRPAAALPGDGAARRWRRRALLYFLGQAPALPRSPPAPAHLPLAGQAAAPLFCARAGRWRSSAASRISTAAGQKSKRAEELAGPAAEEREKKEQEKEKSNEVPLSG